MMYLLFTVTLATVAWTAVVWAMEQDDRRQAEKISSSSSKPTSEQANEESSDAQSPSSTEDCVTDSDGDITSDCSSPEEPSSPRALLSSKPCKESKLLSKVQRKVSSSPQFRTSGLPVQAFLMASRLRAEHGLDSLECGEVMRLVAERGLQTTSSAASTLFASG